MGLNDCEGPPSHPALRCLDPTVSSREAPTPPHTPAMDPEAPLDLSFLSEEEQSAILQVLLRDSELRSLEEGRISKLRHSVLDPSELKILTGDWFSDMRSTRHQDQKYGPDIVRASIRRKKTPKEQQFVLGSAPIESTEQQFVLGSAPIESAEQQFVLGSAPIESTEQQFVLGSAPIESAEQQFVMGSSPIESAEQQFVMGSSPIESAEQQFVMGSSPIESAEQQFVMGSSPIESAEQQFVMGSAPIESAEQQFVLGSASIESTEQQFVLGSAPIESAEQQFVMGSAPTAGLQCSSLSAVIGGTNLPGGTALGTAAVALPSVRGPWSLDTVDKHSPVETEEGEEAAQVSAVPDPLNGTADLQGKYHQKHFLYSLDNQVIAENGSLDTVDKHSPVETEEREEAAQVSAVPDPLNGTADLQGKYHQKHFLYSLDNQVIAENGFDIFCYKTRVVFLLDVGENCILTVNLSGSMMSLFSSGEFGALEVKGSVLFALHYDDHKGEFQIKVYRCQDLAEAKKQRSDPYVKSYLLPDKSSHSKRKTSVRKKCINPVFDETLKTPMSPECISSRGRISLALQFIPAGSQGSGTPLTGELHFWLKEAQNIIPTKGSTIDTFLKSYVLPDDSKSSRQKTRVVKKSLSPAFNHTMVYDGFQREDLKEACAEFTLWEHQTFSSLLLGGVRLSLGTGFSYGQPVSWMDSTEEEIAAWRAMISQPGTWVDISLPLRTNLLSETYGNVFTFHMGPKKYVVLTGYEAVKEALVTQADDFSERGQMHATDHFSRGGNGKRLQSPFIQNCSRNGWFTGVIFGKGESWKVMRRFTLSTLRDFGMGRKTIEDRIIEESQRLVEVFWSHKGKPFDPQIIINSAVSNIICSIVFGDRFDYGDAQFLNLHRILNGIVSLFASPKAQLYNMFPFLGFFLSDHKTLQTNRIILLEYFINAYKDRKDSVDSNDLRSFIDTFISRQREEDARNSNNYFHEDNMAITSANLFAAGTETTSTTLRWGLLLIMQLDLTPTPGLTSSPQPFQLCALSR
ncbi:UNVERIFIED_CONTAM: hypothetical protein FKN15_062716 [Acipenser sinensis]